MRILTNEEQTQIRNDILILEWQQKKNFTNKRQKEIKKKKRQVIQ